MVVSDLIGDAKANPFAATLLPTVDKVGRCGGFGGWGEEDDGPKKRWSRGR
jgi:hypothetical protein